MPVRVKKMKGEKERRREGEKERRRKNYFLRLTCFASEKRLDRGWREGEKERSWK